MAVDLSMSVLVVDDYNTMIRIIRNLLKQLGFENIDDASDGSAALNKMRSKKYGLVISDSVTACGIFIALYYGITGFACAWYYRKTLTNNARDFFMQGVIPVAGGLMLFFAMGWSFYLDLKTSGDDFASYTLPDVPGLGQVGGVAVIVVVAAIIGLGVMIAYWIARPAFFRGETLHAGTPTMVPDEN